MLIQDHLKIFYKSIMDQNFRLDLYTQLLIVGVVLQGNYLQRAIAFNCALLAPLPIGHLGKIVFKEPGRELDPMLDDSLQRLV